ncbi:MAG: BatA domain-containing protein, partial [Bacteroidota bacterium]
MTFLNPGVLWGLLALAVPIIVHFFNLQRPKQIPFSNVAFVKEVKKSVVRRVRFQQWLLLFARLLAIAGLVLAFANPVIIDDNQSVLQGNRSVALVIDNSYSMTAGNEKGEYLQQAISLARNIIKAYGRQDEFLLMTTQDLKLNYNFAEQEEVLEELKTVKVSQNIRPHTEILSFAPQIFQRASNPLKKVYFLSDFQRSTVMTDSTDFTFSDSSLIVKYIPLASRPQNNVYIAETKINSQIVEVDKPVDMSMTLINDGEANIRDLSIRVMLDGKAVAISNKSLDPDASDNIELSFTPTKSGWQGGYIELDDNPIDFDNQRFFTLYVPEMEKVLIVEGERSANMRILYGELGQFDAEFISYRSLSTVNLSDYRSLVLLGLPDISSGMTERLKSY